MREYIDGVGIILAHSINLGKKRTYYGDRLYNRWYGLYHLSGSVVDKWKMTRRNG